MERERISCPFLCGFEAVGDSLDYQIMLHMETDHSEDGHSPFLTREDASVAALASLDNAKDEDYVNCPVEGCGEALLLTELDNHVEMHEEEQTTGDEREPSPKRLKLEPQIEAAFDTTLSHGLRNLADQKDTGSEIEKLSHDRQSSAKAIWKSMLRMPDPSSKLATPDSSTKNVRRRLGKSELGPHANEKQMPAWLVNLLKENDGAIKTVNRIDRDGKTKRVRVCPNMMSGIVPVLEQLLRQDKSVDYAYLCHPAVRHVSKLKREGGFCGYRNIQMLTSYIISVESQGHENFNGKIPTIFEIQNYIEHAWDLGINAQGRIETGGIRGTRKYIGTPDAQAMLCSLGIACDAQGLKPKGTSKPAYELLFRAVEEYFVNSCLNFDSKVRSTSVPPIYFQHPGHSMTIIGFEKNVDGSKNLIVFDPMFHDSPNITKVIGQSFKSGAPQDHLKAYRKGVKYLKNYNEFELLKLTPPKKPV